ncbi:MAG TPA: hypothetical protein VN429_10410, partial [Methanospirillum sp.]|uniref:hypothetical protein n=1 Tax=Methanospirillum sp. TaxID=45200 RepID=UPI002C91E8A0
KGHCLYLNPDLVLGIQSCGITNLSEFVNLVLEETILLNNPDYSPGKQAKIIADKLRKEVAAQRKIVEEQRTFEEQARDLVESRTRVFSEVADSFFINQSSWFGKLPDLDPYGDQEPAWRRAVKVLSDECGFPVTVEECQRFVKSRGFES